MSHQSLNSFMLLLPCCLPLASDSCCCCIETTRKMTLCFQTASGWGSTGLQQVEALTCQRLLLAAEVPLASLTLQGQSEKNYHQILSKVFSCWDHDWRGKRWKQRKSAVWAHHGCHNSANIRRYGCITEMHCFDLRSWSVWLNVLSSVLICLVKCFDLESWFVWLNGLSPVLTCLICLPLLCASLGSYGLFCPSGCSGESSAAEGWHVAGKAPSDGRDRGPIPSPWRFSATLEAAVIHLRRHLSSWANFTTPLPRLFSR